MATLASPWTRAASTRPGPLVPGTSRHSALLARSRRPLLYRRPPGQTHAPSFITLPVPQTLPRAQVSRATFTSFDARSTTPPREVSRLSTELPTQNLCSAAVTTGPTKPLGPADLAPASGFPSVDPFPRRLMVLGIAWSARTARRTFPSRRSVPRLSNLRTRSPRLSILQRTEGWYSPSRNSDAPTIRTPTPARHRFTVAPWNPETPRCRPCCLGFSR